MSNPVLVLLTGGIASGKSTVEKIFEEKGFSVLDTDKVVFELYHQEDVIKELEKEFGENIITDCVVDKCYIRNHILIDFEKLFRLERIIHPRVYQWCAEWSNERTMEDRCISIPLLFETTNEQFIKDIGDHVIVTVSCDKVTQLSRAIGRGMSFTSALKLFLRQMDNWSKVQTSDYVIDNTLSEENLRINTLSTISKIRNRRLN